MPSHLSIIIPLPMIVIWLPGSNLNLDLNSENQVLIKFMSQNWQMNSDSHYKFERRKTFTDNPEAFVSDKSFMSAITNLAHLKFMEVIEYIE